MQLREEPNNKGHMSSLLSPTFTITQEYCFSFRASLQGSTPVYIQCQKGDGKFYFVAHYKQDERSYVVDIPLKQTTVPKECVRIRIATSNNEHMEIDYITFTSGSCTPGKIMVFNLILMYEI